MKKARFEAKEVYRNNAPNIWAIWPRPHTWGQPVVSYHDTEEQALAEIERLTKKGG